jgi:nucleoside-diphosphate-sugar epimerase
MKRILVTGANGFIGQALCSALSEAGFIVRGAVRVQEAGALKEKVIDIVPVGDIGPETDWTAALNGIDAIVHLAGRAPMTGEILKDPLSEYRRVNTAGTEHLARSAVKAGVNRIVYLSTVKVNGEMTGDAPFSESDISNPEGYYAISKWEAELALQWIARETRLEVVILRLPLVYGPGVKANFLRLIDLVARRIPLPLANVNNRRSLIYLGNLTDAIATCIIHSKAAGQTYMVSDSENISTPELVRIIASAMGIKPRLMPFPLFLLRVAGRLTGKIELVRRLTDSLSINSDKIRRELGWKPPFTLEQGICEAVKWYKSR